MSQVYTSVIIVNYSEKLLTVPPQQINHHLHNVAQFSTKINNCRMATWQYIILNEWNWKFTEIQTGIDCADCYYFVSLNNKIQETLIAVWITG